MYTVATDPLLLLRDTHTLKSLSLDQLIVKLYLNLVLGEAEHPTVQQIRLWLHLAAY